MGIYDREYVRVGPRSKSGLGSIRFISFNSWLIIINVLVFVADMTLGRYPVPVVIDVQATRQVDRKLQLESVFRDALGNPLPERVPTVTRDRQGNVHQGPTVRNPALSNGAIAYVRLGDPRTQEVVGSAKVAFMPPLSAYGHFSTQRGFFQLEVWRYITFQFLHGGVTHLFFNMFGLWIFGGMVEQYLGFKRYAAFYLTCGVFGAVSYLILNLLGAGFGLRLPGVLFDSLYTPLVGASAGVFGVIMACAYIAPNAIVQLLFPPIPMKLKWFAYGYVAFAGWNLLRGGSNAGGDAAHIGGAVAGFFFVRNAHLLRDFFDIFGDSRRRRFGGGREKRRPEDSEVDRILTKVQSDGLASLSDSEKRTLRRSTDRRRNA
jgi:membrane associated rhomboid family serine protease